MKHWYSYLSETRCKWSTYGPADATTTPPIVCCLIKIQNSLFFWYHRAQVVLKKKLWNKCFCYCYRFCYICKFSFLVSFHQEKCCCGYSCLNYLWHNFTVHCLVGRFIVKNSQLSSNFMVIGPWVPSPQNIALRWFREICKNVTPILHWCQFLRTLAAEIASTFLSQEMIPWHHIQLAGTSIVHCGVVAGCVLVLRGRNTQ